MRRSVFLLVSVTLIFSFGELAHARRHHKFKGVIIVNQILKLEGTITNDGKPVPEYSGVKQGDILETGENSTAIIRIPGLAIFKMGALTRFHLVSFSNRDESRFEVEKGQVLSLFRRPGHHIFQTPHSTVTLHGTTFFTKSDVAKTDSSLSDFFCLCDGKIQVQVKNVKRNPTSESAPSPAPSPSPYTGAQISAMPEARSSPVAIASPTAASRELKKELEVVSQGEHKQFEVSFDGIEIRDSKNLESHTAREIQDLESLYSLP